jgi:NADH dehydrogenase FAD-containing subunit
MAWRQRVVVVGAGFGGLAVARALREENLDVLVLDRTNHHVFQPLLYQVATCALSPAEIATPIRSILRGQKNVEVVFTEVSSVNLAARRLETSTGPIDSPAEIPPGSGHTSMAPMTVADSTVPPAPVVTSVLMVVVTVTVLS